MTSASEPFLEIFKNSRLSRMMGRPHTPTALNGASGVRRAKWTRAVSTQPPTLFEAEDGRTVGTANIQCWRGTVDELCVPMTELAQAVGSPGGTQHAEITWANGLQQVEDDVESLRRALKEGQPGDLLMARFTVMAAGGSVEGTLLARAKLPGLSLEVMGVNRPQVLGVTELTFHQMMIGYVDRIGGWRLLAWLLSGYGPTLLAIIGTSRIHISHSPLIAIPIALLTIALLVLSMTLSYEALLVKRPLKIEPKPIPRRSERTAGWVRSTYRHPLTRRVLALIGALIIGILGSELANVIPWPWAN